MKRDRTLKMKYRAWNWIAKEMGNHQHLIQENARHFPYQMMMWCVLEELRLRIEARMVRLEDFGMKLKATEQVALLIILAKQDINNLHPDELVYRQDWVGKLK